MFSYHIFHNIFSVFLQQRVYKYVFSVCSIFLYSWKNREKKDAVVIARNSSNLVVFEYGFSNFLFDLIFHAYTTFSLHFLIYSAYWCVWVFFILSLFLNSARNKKDLYLIFDGFRFYYVHKIFCGCGKSGRKIRASECKNKKCLNKIEIKKKREKNEFMYFHFIRW